MCNRFSPTAWLVAGAASLQVLGSTCAIAQSKTPVSTDPANKDAAVALQEIVVTARRTKESLHEIPASITVLPSQTIQDAGVKSFQDMTQLVPNFTVFENWRAGQPFISMRGISTPQGGEPPVAVLVDGVQVPSLEFVQTGLYDIKDVQVLRGPQGALYGRGAIAGAVLIETEDPTNHLEASTDLYRGNGHTYRVSGVASGPLVTDKLWFRIMQAYDDTKGFNPDPTVGINADGSHEATTELELLAKPTDGLRLTLHGFYEQGRDGASYFAVVTNSQLNDFSIPTLSNLPITDQRRLESLSFRLDWTGILGTLTSISQYAKSRSYTNGDADWSPLPIAEQWGVADVNATSEDLRFSSPSRGPLSWVAGIFIQHRDSPTNTYVAAQPGGLLPPTTPPLLQSYDFEQSKSYAAYGQAVYHFGGAYELTTALRYDTDRRFGEDLATPGSAISHTFSAWQPSVTLQRTFTPAVNAYVTFGEGFRSGGFNPLVDSQIAGIAREYPKEVSRNFEIGTKTEWLDGKLMLNADLFHMIFDNEQFYFVHIFPDYRAIVSFPRTHINGGELELRAVPMNGLTLSAGLGVSDGIIDSSGASGTYNGNHSPLSNRYTFNLAAEDRVPLTSRLSGLLRVAYDGRGRAYWDQTNELSQSPVETLSARIGMESDCCSLSILGKNLTNRRYAEYVGPNNFGPGIDSRIPNIPRTYGLELTARY
jgi:iron complex outermembrane receptor protein